jgi:hypothetical protein
MNSAYFEHYRNFIIPPYISAIVGASLLLFAIITLILAICLFGRKNRGLYAVNKTMSVIGLVAGILLTVVYAVFIGLVAISPELFAYQGGGFIGGTRDLACGIFLAPAKFGIQIDSAMMNTRLPFIFYTVTICAPAIISFIVFITSCLAQRSSRKARKKAAEAKNASPVNNISGNIPQPTPAPVPAPVPAAEPFQPVQDNAPINEAPIQKLIPDTSPVHPVEEPVVADSAPAETEKAPDVAEIAPVLPVEEPVVADNAPAETEKAPDVAEIAPVLPVEEPVVADNAPAETEEATEVPEIFPATPVEADNSPAETTAVITDAEKPINEEKILNLVSAPPAENTLSNDAPLFCIKCGTALNGGSFCMNCGTPAVSKAKTCKSCNAELAEDAKFCMICGTKTE